MNNREANWATNHPPTCNCVDCTHKRLVSQGILRYCSTHDLYYPSDCKEGCPRCDEEETKSFFEILKKIIPEPLRQQNQDKLPHQEPTNKPISSINQPLDINDPGTSHSEPNRKPISPSNQPLDIAPSNNSHAEPKYAPGLPLEIQKEQENMNREIPNKYLSLILIFALLIIGLGISLYVESFIPLGMLFLFLSIYSIQRWFGYVTRKYKWVGQLYKLLLNLILLLSMAFIGYTGLKLFSQQFLRTPVIGSLVFLSEIGFFIWLCKIYAKNAWRWPSMKLTIISLIFLFAVFSFAGVQPLASFKDNLFNYVGGVFASIESGANVQQLVSKSPSGQYVSGEIVLGAKVYDFEGNTLTLNEVTVIGMRKTAYKYRFTTYNAPNNDLPATQANAI